MLRQSQRIAQAVAAISKYEFIDSISAWPELLHGDKRPIGLAVSGGVDSIALAAMMKNYTDCNLAALVVDHGLRKESTAEALKVADILEQQLGIRTLIRDFTNLKVEDGDCRLDNMCGIETIARKLRFRLLGRACEEYGIRRLLLAQHEDDQYETVLLRLCDHHVSRLGTRPVANFPDCYGIYGIYQSGQRTSVSTISSAHYNEPVTSIEKSSLQLLRPLLHFPKSRLLETCRQFGVPWVEDKSNLDPTFTRRNALRHILKKYRLPEALNKSSVLGLFHTLEDRATGHREAALSLFNRCNLRLEICHGRAMIRIPNDVKAVLLRSLEQKSLESAHLNSVRALFVKHLQSLVQPDRGRSSVSNQGVADFIGFLNAPEQQAATVGEVLVSRIGAHEDIASATCPAQTSNEAFLIHRRPPSVLEKRSKIHDLSFPSSSHPSSFQFWDGRFWVTIFNPSAQTLYMRFFQPQHLHLLKGLLSDKKITVYSSFGIGSESSDSMNLTARDLSAMINGSISGKAKWSLPVLEFERHGQTLPVALPTLGLAFLGLPGADWPKWIDQIRWEVRYKAVDLGSHSMEAAVTGAAERLPNAEKFAALS